VPRSRHHCCSLNAATRSVLIVELNVAVKNTKIHNFVQQCFYCEFISSEIFSYFGLHAKCQRFLSKFGFFDRFS